ncbi:unnamed protein product [Chilo suppressalis]|uniref:Uncharacterized protein n=1 Tax=Chilo suppressalis TaxID=168631 RepID=A0ABN8B1I7_CHISP|nr:unnamed protein product [Chilo suppressalis]
MLLCLNLFLSAYIFKVLSQSFDDDTPVKGIMEDIHEKKAKPVPFGHIFRDGIDDPASGYKVPYDLLELDMRFPHNRKEDKELQRRPRKKVIKIEKSVPSSKVLSPRDMYVDEFMKTSDQSVNNTSVEDGRPKWFNFEQIQKQNAEVIREKVRPKSNTDFILPDKRKAYSNNTKYYEKKDFSSNTFDLTKTVAGDKLSWTTCEEFEKSLKPLNLVYPKDIVDINWEPFYIWSPRKHLIAFVHRFSYPTKKIVKEYKEMYGKFLPKFIDWEQPKLMLNERIEMLLIAGDRKGLFYGIPRQQLPLSIRHKNFTLPPITLRLKIEDPYLAMMYCDELYANIMASPENLPQTNKEKVEEAALLKFKGQGYPIARNIYLEKLKLKGLQEQKAKAEAKKILKALPGYPEGKEVKIKMIIEKVNAFIFESVARMLIIGVIVMFVLCTQVSGKYPEGLRNATTCDEFSKFARFNPYSVLEYNWFVFYYWGPHMRHTEIQFEYPPPDGKAYLHFLLDEHVNVPINWTARFVVMKNLNIRQSWLMVETGDRGQFLKYPFIKTKKKGPKIVPQEVRFKQTGGGKYIAYMDCKQVFFEQRETVFVMARKEDIPPKKKIQDEAARIGFRSRGGKSYLYQGHEWMPIPEDDEQTYWMSEEEKMKEKEKLDAMLKYSKKKNKK